MTKATIVPANPGFSVLRYYRDAGEEDCVDVTAVIAWSIGGADPGPITAESFAVTFGLRDGEWAVEQPDGTVIDGGLHTNRADWVASVKRAASVNGKATP